MYTYQYNDHMIRLDFIDHILRVAIIKDGSDLFPTYSICPDGVMPREGRDKLSLQGFELIDPELHAWSNGDETGFSFTIDDVTFTVRTSGTLNISAENASGPLFSDRPYIAYNLDGALGEGSAHYLSREENEHIFGLGDKSGDIDKNGRFFKLSTSDAMGYDARSSDPLYKHLPFFICENSNGAYGIYYDTYSQGEFSFGTEINNYYGPYKYFRCDEENLVFYVILGTVSEIVSRFSGLCGPIASAPAWTLKYAGSTMAYTDAPDADKKLRNFVTLCEKYEIDCGGFYLSSGYTSIDGKRYVFHWNYDKIPSPGDLSKYFHTHGMEFFPNVKPCFMVGHPMYDALAKKGWFLHYEDGTPALFPFWDDWGSYLDFTNPDAYDFWTDCVRHQLVERGYKNIWNDNNEYDVPDKRVWAHGFGHPVRAYLIRPLFSYLMTMASGAAFDSSDAEKTVLVSRCAIAGTQRLASTWTGDNRTSWEDFRYNHKIAMTMSLSGFFNFGQDIGGFAGPAPDKELFMRWIQYGIFTPRFVLHSWNPDGSATMPWLYPEMMDEVIRLFHLRDALIPYLYEQMKSSAREHRPIIYPVFLKHPEYDIESDAFFFGDNILAAPIFDRGADHVTITLPENNGDWLLRGIPQTDHSTEKKYTAGTHTIPCSIHDLPVFFLKAERT